MPADAVYLDELFVSLQGEAGEIGRPQIFLRLAGCPLRCRYCDTPRSWQRQARFERHVGAESSSGANPLSAAELDQELAELCAQHGMDPRRSVLAVTGGEPLEQVEFLASWLPRWPGRVLLETAGIWPERLQALLPHAHWVSLDWKLSTTLRSGAELCAPRECLALAAAAPHAPEVWVKVVLTETTSDAELAHCLQEIAATAPATRVFLQPVTPFGAGPRPPAAAQLLNWSLRHAALPLDLRVLPQMHPVLGAR